MKFFRAAAAALQPFSDGFKPSENGGRVASGVREHGTKKPLGGAAPTGRSERVDPAERTRAPALVREAEHGGSHATGAKSAPSPLAGEWAAQHRAALAKREEEAVKAGISSGKFWTLHADKQTQAILAVCPERKVKEETAAEYRRTYERLRASGKTPYEFAGTRSQYDKLRTACRYCMEQDIRELRKASDRAMKKNNLDSAQRRTIRAFELAVVLDELFMQPHRLTWKDKPKDERRPSKSKRNTSAPAPDFAGMALLAGARRGMKVADRHGCRLAMLALFGMRPAEFQKGVCLCVVDGGQSLTAEIRGAKVSEKRGQEARVLKVPVNGAAAEGLAAMVKAQGGKWNIETTNADYRSLNRALQTRASISCYTFRHQMGSDLKEAVATGAMQPEEAAQAMGHRSTVSLSYYGSRSRSRGGRAIQAKGLNDVRVVPVSYAAKSKARAEAKASSGVRFAPKPETQRAAAPKAQPPRQVRPSAPKPPRR